MTSALLVIDCQLAFARRTAAGIPRSNPDAESRIAEIIALFRVRGLPVMHIHHDDPRPNSGFRFGTPGGEVMPCAAPLAGETLFVKHGSSGFIGTGPDGVSHSPDTMLSVPLGALAILRN
jgi:nicotinamidase-related amidase